MLLTTGRAQRRHQLLPQFQLDGWSDQIEINFFENNIENKKMAPNERSAEDSLGCSRQILTSGKSSLVFFVNGNLI
jgi:hypothetical protein